MSIFFFQWKKSNKHIQFFIHYGNQLKIRIIPKHRYSILILYCFRTAYTPNYSWPNTVYVIMPSIITLEIIGYGDIDGIGWHPWVDYVWPIILLVTIRVINGDLFKGVALLLRCWIIGLLSPEMLHKPRLLLEEYDKLLFIILTSNVVLLL